MADGGFYDDPTLEGGVLLVDLDGAVVLTFAGAPCTDGICPYASDPFGNGSAAFAYQVEISVQPEPTAVRPTRRAPLFGGDRPPSRARASQGGPGATVVQTVGMTLTVGGGGFDLTTGYNQATGQGLLGPDDFCDRRQPAGTGAVSVVVLPAPLPRHPGVRDGVAARCLARCGHR